MANIIDAFLVTLGLDSTEFKAGARESQGEMSELQKKSKELAEETKKGQTEMAVAVKAAQEKVMEAERAAETARSAHIIQVHELEKAVIAGGQVGKVAASALKVHNSEYVASSKAAAQSMKVLKGDVKVAETAMMEFGRVSAQKADEVRREIKELENKAKEAAEKLREDGEKGAEFFDKLKEHAIEFLGIMASVGALVMFTESTIKANTEINHLSEETKMATEDISLWQNAVIMAGGSAEGFNQSLKGMGEQLVAIEKGLPRAQRALKAFEAAGIHGMGKGKHVEITEMYEQIHDKLSKLSMAEAMTLGKRMQLDEATIRVLHKSGEAYEEFMGKARAAGTVTKEQAEAAEKAEEGMNQFKIGMQRAMELIVELALPAITALTDMLTKVTTWARDNSGTIQVVLSVIAAAALYAGSSALIAGGQMAVAWVSALGPIAWVAAAIIAVIVVFKMLYNKFEGFRNVVNSVFGFIKNYVLTFVEYFKDQFNDLFGIVNSILSLIVGVFTVNSDKIKSAWGALCGYVNDSFKNAWEMIELTVLLHVLTIVRAFRSIWPAVKESAREPLQWIEDKLSKVAGVVSKVIGLFHHATVAAAIAVAPVAPAVAATHANPTAAAPVPITSTAHPAHRAYPQAQPSEATESLPAPTAASSERAEAWKKIVDGLSANLATNRTSEHSAVTDVLNRQAAMQQASIKHVASTSNITKETHIGQMNVNAPLATDANGIAHEMGSAIRAHSSTTDHADGGMA